MRVRMSKSEESVGGSGRVMVSGGRVLVMRGEMVQVMRVRGDAAGVNRDMKD